MTDDATYRRAVQRGDELERERDELKSTLRDHFAGIALGAMIGNTTKDDCSRGRAGVDIFPDYAYEYADAMLAARKAQS